MESSLDLNDKFEGITCFWKIENFCACEFNDYLLLKSQIFDVKMLRSKFHLECEMEQNFLNIYLFKDGYMGTTVLKFTITILTSSGWLSIDKTHEGSFESQGFAYGRDNIVEWKEMFEHKELYLPNNSLLICCRMWNSNTEGKAVQYLLTSRMATIKRIKHSSVKKYTTLCPSSFIQTNLGLRTRDEGTQTDVSRNKVRCDFKNDIRHFYAENEFRFVTLRVPNKDFVVHEALLCSRSPVFKAMFDKDTKENQKRIVDIHDVNCETLSRFLKFLHIQPFDDLDWAEAAKLYYVADKYQIEELKTECRLRLKHNLNLKNICDTFLLSDLHQDEKLKQYAQEYFCKHSKEILLSNDWHDLLYNKTDLAAEILRVLAENI